MLFRRGPWSAGRGHPLNLGKLLEQPRRIARFPGHGASEPQVVGQRFGSSPLAEYLGQSPGVDGQVERPLRLEADHAVQATDRLEVLSHPGQAEGPVVPGGGIGGVFRRQPPEQVGRRVEVLVALAPHAVIPDSPASRDRPASRNRYAVRAASGKSDADSRAARACSGRDGIGVDPQRTLPASPGGQRALALQMIPAFVNQGRR